MTRLLPALLLAGCLQGGAPELDGTWTTTMDVERCYVSITFGPGDRYSNDRVCEAATDPGAGTYAVEGDVLHLADETGSYDLRWEWTARDLLLLSWPGHVLRLERSER